MEGFAENAFSEFELLGLTPSYNTETNSFQADETGVPVRQVSEKKLPARDPVTQKILEDKFDVFTGLIDGVTGEPLHGTRTYVLTCEIYEGPFANCGCRHGEGALVKNIHLPLAALATEEESSQDEGELIGPAKSTCSLGFSHANFYGAYLNDEPHYGTLVTDTFTYRGHFMQCLFHGLNGELVHTSGYRYTGEFREGLLHGTGRELEPHVGEYQGEFRCGARDGYGTFKSKQESPVDDAAVINDETQESQQGSADGRTNRYIHSGSYRRGQKHGEGTEWTMEGNVYTGMFAADERHGHGQLKLLLSDVSYEGQWRVGKAVDGNGWRVLYPSGDVYLGELKGFEPNGYGIYKYENGSSFSGNFVDGQRHGNGIFSDANGTEFSGVWTKDVNVSIGHLEQTDGTLCDIAETLRSGEATERGEGEDDSKGSKHSKQLSFLKQAMAKSIETSLHIISHQTAGTKQSSDKSRPRRIRRRSSIANERSEIRRESRAELHIYANGDTFLGALDSGTGQRAGYGVYVSKGSRCTYTGEFRKGLRCGYGILIHSDYGKYAGEFWDDRKHGLGTLILSDGSSYHGIFRKGVFEGKGTLCERDGTIYVGEWRGGLRHGEGMETMRDGRVYQGSFFNGQKDGSMGTLLDKTGGRVIYRGSWRDNLYHGEGTMIMRNASDLLDSFRYDGAFAHGERHGYGVLTCASEGTVCKGMFNKDKPLSGKWRICYSDGSIYSGHARTLERDDLVSLREHHVVVVPHGFGTKKYQDGNVYVGSFKHGKRKGIGMCMFSSGDQWEGNWNDDDMDKESLGKLRLTLADGTVREYASNRPIM